MLVAHEEVIMDHVRRYVRPSLEIHHYCHHWTRAVVVQGDVALPGFILATGQLFGQALDQPIWRRPIDCGGVAR